MTSEVNVFLDPDVLWCIFSQAVADHSCMFTSARLCGSRTGGKHSECASKDALLRRFSAVCHFWLRVAVETWACTLKETAGTSMGPEEYDAAMGPHKAPCASTALDCFRAEHVAAFAQHNREVAADEVIRMLHRAFGRLTEEQRQVYETAELSSVQDYLLHYSMRHERRLLLERHTHVIRWLESHELRKDPGAALMRLPTLALDAPWRPTVHVKAEVATLLTPESQWDCVKVKQFIQSGLRQARRLRAMEVRGSFK